MRRPSTRELTNAIASDWAPAGEAIPELCQIVGEGGAPAATGNEAGQSGLSRRSGLPPGAASGGQVQALPGLPDLSPRGLFVTVVLTVAVAELAIMSLLRFIPGELASWAGGLDAALLVCALLPVLYWGQYLPLARRMREVLTLSRTLVQANTLLEARVRERTADLSDKTRQLEVIAHVHTAVLETGDWSRAGTVLLRAALEIVGGPAGLVGVVNGSSLRLLAHEGGGRCPPGSMADGGELRSLDLAGSTSPLARVVSTKLPVLSNDPAREFAAPLNLQPLPPPSALLGMPILNEGVVVGAIVLVNRPGGYTSVEVEKLGRLARMTGAFFVNYLRQERDSNLQEQLREAQKMEAVGRLSAGVAHDFNNLLTPITGYAEIVKASISATDPELGDCMEQIILAAGRGAELTRRLLGFSRRQTVQLKVLQINEIVQGLEKMLRRLIGADIELLVELDDKVGLVEADPGMMEQVILNLIVNARDAMPTGGRLSLSTRTAAEREAIDASDAGRAGPGYVVIDVRDEGVGMSEEVRVRIFDPFFTTKREGQGTGLGLATVSSILKQHKGHIRVHSQPGAGALFSVYLPRTTRNPENHSTQVSVPSTSTKCKETVLIVDDEPAVRALVERALRKQGYVTLVAGTGQEALRMLRQDGAPAVDLLLTDVIMPGMNGVELVDTIRSTFPTLRAIYLSGYEADFLAQLGLRERGDRLIQKPVSLALLSQEVRKALDA